MRNIAVRPLIDSKEVRAGCQTAVQRRRWRADYFRLRSYKIAAVLQNTQARSSRYEMCFAQWGACHGAFQVFSDVHCREMCFPLLPCSNDRHSQCQETRSCLSKHCLSTFDWFKHDPSSLSLLKVSNKAIGVVPGWIVVVEIFP